MHNPSRHLKSTNARAHKLVLCVKTQTSLNGRATELGFIGDAIHFHSAFDQSQSLTTVCCCVFSHSHKATNQTRIQLSPFLK